MQKRETEEGNDYPKGADMKKKISIAWASWLVAVARLCGWVARGFRRANEIFLEKAILPCPKCGRKGGDFFETGMELMQIIRCENCDYSGEGVWDDYPKAILLWNKNR
jgi:hypothetical protein